MPGLHTFGLSNSHKAATPSPLACCNSERECMAVFSLCQSASAGQCALSAFFSRFLSIGNINS